jgi:hypothetical protein
MHMHLRRKIVSIFDPHLIQTIMIRPINIFALMITALALTMPIARAQKTPFSGTIVYDIKAEGNVPEIAKSVMPTVMTYQFSADKQSMALNFPMMEQKTIFDPATKKASILMNVIGQKLVIDQTAAEIEELRKQQGETIGVKETNETKSIAGYLCKKTVITKKTKDGRENNSNIYYTDAINASKFKMFNTFPEIDGFPLEFSMKSGQVDLKVTARSVVKQNVPASQFVIGSDYKQVSAADLQKLFGSMSLFGK